MLSLLRTKGRAGASSRRGVSRDLGRPESVPAATHLEPADDLPRLPALARMVEEGERTSAGSEASRSLGRSVAERVQRFYAFD